MFSRLAKILLGTMVGLLVFTLVYITYFYFEGYMLARSCLNSVTYYVMSENCISSDKVYLEGGSLTSVQDKVVNMLDDYSNNSWYLKFDTSGDVFGYGDNYPVSCYYTDPTGNVVEAFSYDYAAPRGTVLTVELRCEFEFPLRLVPNGSSAKPVTLKLPVNVKTKIVGTKYYKGTEDTFR